MPKKLPTYSLHKSTGQARIWLNGKDHYLGTYGSEESRLRYAELIKQAVCGLAVDPIVPQKGASDSGPTVNEIANAYRTFAEGYYVKNGKQTDEVQCIYSAMRPLVNLFGDIPAKEFGPAALKAVRQRMIDDKDKCRSYINKSIGRIRRLFSYAVECEMIPPSVLVGLKAVRPLLAGRTEAIDHPKRTAVPKDHLDAVRNKVSQQTRDMIDLAALSGMRPGELVSLTPEMIDRSSDVWIAILDDHKTAHQGRVRVIAFGPKSQVIIRKYLKRSRDELLFPMARCTFSNRLKRACDELKIPRFTGHWLRHSAATDIRETHGLDGVQVILGHASADTSQIYAHLSVQKAMEIARQVG